MGLRIWIKTKREPVFPVRVEWSFLNQKLCIDNADWWFFQDEWRLDASLMSVCKIDTSTKELQLKLIDKSTHLDTITKFASISNDDIDNYFLNAWDRPLVFWDSYRFLTISYLEAKRDYIKSLVMAGIDDTAGTNEFGEALVEGKYAPWYEYRYDGPEKRRPRIPGRVSPRWVE